MIVIKIELHSVVTGKVTEIGRAHIINKETGGLKLRDYNVSVARRNKIRMFSLGAWPEAIIREGEVLKFPSQSYNVWRLVIRALLSCFPEEHK